MLIYFHIVYGYFHATMAELSTCDGDFFALQSLAYLLSGQALLQSFIDSQFSMHKSFMSNQTQIITLYFKEYILRLSTLWTSFTILINYIYIF